jgi:hypothetical protein
MIVLTMRAGDLELAVGHLHLSEADQIVLQDELFRSEATMRILQERARVAATASVQTPETMSERRQAWADRDRSATESYERLQGRLSADGRQKLWSYVQAQKSNMRLYGP